jgi:hypothetical protein
MAVVEEFFDASFLAELEGLAATAAPDAASASQLPEKYAEFLAPEPGSDQPLDEEGFVRLPPARLAERTNRLIAIGRQSPRPGALQAVESFVVFFQALVPTLPDAAAIRRAFFRLVPTLLHIAWNDFGDAEDQRREGREALQQLEAVLLEISSVRLAPTEGELVFRSIDQLGHFIGAGQYALASELIAARLLGLVARNRLTRALYRIMEVEVAVQVYLKQKLGCGSPRLRIPEDLAALSDYGPIRVLRDEAPDGGIRRYIQVQLPNLPTLRDVVLHLAREDGTASYDLRLDAVGSALLEVPPGAYGIGLIYQPQE